MSKIRILFVEDNLNLGFLTREFLESEGFDVKIYKDGESGLNAFKEHTVDLCLLDVMLPKMDGFELATKIRVIKPEMPIIFLTAKNLKEDKHIGFDIGADDYITKPFDEDELLWRINALMKRSKGEKEKLEPVPENQAIGSLNFVLKNQQLIHGDVVIRLTERETKVLNILLRNQGNITTRKELLEEIWGENDYFAGRSLDVFIAKLRKYLKADESVVIENVPRVGFILKVGS